MQSFQDAASLARRLRVGDLVFIGIPHPPFRQIADHTLSRANHVDVARLSRGLTPEQERALVHAARRRLGVLYDTGFNLASRRQFCSRFVREVLQEATGSVVGQVPCFEELLAANPRARLTFWRLWFFGRIPWQRLTVTPASLLASPQLAPVFDGVLAQAR